ncbi:MAG: hypothetical protein NT141_02490 [candidate division WWE3 bacterium]|nr:hypothetical protein [candidate division WWE3 bacterium]
MKPTKYTFNETNKIDLGTKVIYKYPTPTNDFDIAKMVIKGRSPEESSKFLLEHVCQFVMLVTRGSGKVFTEAEVFEVTVDDVIFIPTECIFAVEGDFEYITVDLPAFYPEQSEEVTS